MTQVRAFAKSKNSNTIIIQWKDGKEDNFGVDDANKELIKLEEFIQQMFEPVKVIMSEEGELPFGTV